MQRLGWHRKTILGRVRHPKRIATSTAHSGGDRRVHPGVPSVTGGAALGKFAGDRNVDGRDVVARDPFELPFAKYRNASARPEPCVF